MVGQPRTYLRDPKPGVGARTSVIDPRKTIRPSGQTYRTLMNQLMGENVLIVGICR